MEYNYCKRKLYFFLKMNKKITKQKCIFEMKHDLYKEKMFSETKND